MSRAKRRVADVPIGLLAVEQREAVVVLARDHEVLHARVGRHLAHASASKFTGFHCGWNFS
jgi:hypothetical protein